MNELQVFENAQFGQIRTIQKDGQPWFVAADVCRALEHSNSRMALERLDEDEKGVSSIYTPGGRQEVSIVNEPGLYSLVLGSRKPEAKAFKRWIVHDVLPAIRKTGAYAVPGSAADAALQRAQAMLLNAKTRQFNAIMKAVKDKHLSPIAAEVFGITALEQATGHEIAYRPQIEQTYSAGDIAREMGVSGALVGRVANLNGLKTDEYGIRVLDKARGHDKQVLNFRYNERGRRRLCELIRQREDVAN